MDNAYRENSDRLINQIVKSFSDAENLKPSEAYRAIAMLPIALRLTTNYEDLLERAIRDLGPAYKQLIPDTDSMSLTWADGPKVLDLVRSEKPGVVKIHGHIAYSDEVDRSFRRQGDQDSGMKAIALGAKRR